MFILVIYGNILVKSVLFFILNGCSSMTNQSCAFFDPPCISQWLSWKALPAARFEPGSSHTAGGRSTTKPPRPKLSNETGHRYSSFQDSPTQVSREWLETNFFHTYIEHNSGIICGWTNPGSCWFFDTNQYGALKQRSISHALVSVLHHWSTALDSDNSMRALFVDYAKAFDQLDHNVLLNKTRDRRISIRGQIEAKKFCAAGSRPSRQGLSRS